MMVARPGPGWLPELEMGALASQVAAKTQKIAAAKATEPTVAQPKVEAKVEKQPWA